MSRHKFRAWDKEEEKIIDWQYLIGYCDIDYLFGNIEENPKRDTVPDFEVMQFTGLKDKNGVEIYEGDIVERMYIFKGEYGETHMGEVVYDKEYARYVISRPKKHIEPKIEDLRNTLSDKCSYEVLGNVYENPEILEVER